MNWKSKKALRYLPGLILPLLFVGFTVYFFVFSTPERIIEMVGVNNAYMLIFVLAFLGGLTTFSGLPYHLLLITLATGGLKPSLLGISAAAGVMLGDSTSYYVGYHGGAIAPQGIQKFFKQAYFFSSRHQIMLPLFCLAYGSLVPFSNDFITISAGIARYPFWRVMIPLGIGNLIFNISLAYFSPNAYNFLFNTIFN
ncbi:MAG: hypothetical protein HYT12_03600 [Candidatus Liptonbacteria bacterium]|nr:hypothetical protein [Candidatus Liptonbacteria bacterium]